MTYKPSIALACATLGLASTLGCPTIDDPFESLTSLTNQTMTTMTTETGEGDGDPTGDGDPGDGDPGDGDPSGDGDGDPGDGDPSGDGDGDPMGGDPYNLMGCMAPSQALTLMGVEGAWCAPPCMANNADCPAGPQGTMAVCGIVSPMAPDMMMPDSCVLLCDMMNDACPTGSTCKEVPDQMQPLFVCTYP